jgi:Leucine-rich repeat (LRR) protein
MEACQLTALPPQIGELLKLEFLNVRNNSLVTLPPCLGEMRRRSLKQFDWEQNYIDALPPELLFQGDPAFMGYSPFYLEALKGTIPSTSKQASEPSSKKRKNP